MKSLMVIVAVATWSVVAAAEEIELFRASQAGEQAWVWDTAQAKLKDSKLLVRTSKESGNAYIADRFPYFGNAKVEVAVAEVTQGNYTIQALGFSSNQHVATANLADSSTVTGRQQFDLKAAKFDRGVDQVMFKIWVGGAKDAAVVFDDLVLTLPLSGFAPVMDEPFKDMTAWENESLVVSNTEAGVFFTLKPGTTFGSVRGLKRIAKRDGMSLLWNVGRADGGDASLQVVAFDQNGKYLKSIDVVKNARTGWHAASLGSLGWPADAAAFEAKIWAGGNPSAVIRFGRLLILQPAP